MKHLLLVAWVLSTTHVYAQQDSVNKTRQRLDFASTYFELGGTVFPSFTGKKWVGDATQTFKNPASVNQYLTWGAFHFWGRAEIYVTIPLSQANFKENSDTDFQLIHSATTGMRFYPWAYRPGKLRPYVGLSWSALDFQQKFQPDRNQPMLSKDLMVAYDVGVLYGYGNFALRAGVHFFPDNKWKYPLNKTYKEQIKTPSTAFQLGLIYTMDLSRREDEKTQEKWNSYPTVSKLSLDAEKFGDFFIGAGPSTSYSLVASAYNQTRIPYLKNRLTSTNYFDLAVGYHFFKAGLFTALSFRNPKFETEGYGSRQTIRKTSLTFEINKFLLDYTGFAPYIGLSIALDKLDYSENIEGIKREFTFGKNLEPGLTIGWDIRPGKNSEALILRTNLRWYPYASFKVDGIAFDFSQLEYNLIQLVLYPAKLKKRH